MAVQISDWNDLDAMRNDLTADYVLSNSLDSSTTGYSGVGDNWGPVGDSNNYFKGSFDGQDYSINDLVVDSGGNNVGFFGVIYGATIQNVHLNNADVTGDENVGILVGNDEEASTITGCSTDGVVDGRKQVGGAIGYMDSAPTVEYCYSSADVSYGGTSTDVGWVGGFVGQPYNSQIKYCMASGNVSAPDGENVGGFAGSDGDYSYCYALGDVEGNNYVAGFIGDGYSSSIDHCYSKGNVSGSSDVRGFSRRGGTITDCYFDTETSGQTDSEATGLTTSEMTGSSATSNMSSFDFTNNWETVENSQDDASGDGYPILQSLERKTQLEQQGLYINLVTASGSVVEGGTGIDSATVEVIPHGGSSGYQTTTDSNGDWSIDVPPDTYHFVARYEDSNGKRRTLSKPFISVN